MGLPELKVIVDVLQATGQDLRIDDAKGLLSDIEYLSLALERISSHQLNMRFKIRKDQWLNRLRLWKEEQERHIKWLQDLPAIAPQARNYKLNAAWSRDIEAWREKDNNCD